MGPVVGVTVPDAQRVPDALAPQERGELPVVVAYRVAASDRENDVLPAESVEPEDRARGA